MQPHQNAGGLHSSCTGISDHTKALGRRETDPEALLSRSTLSCIHSLCCKVRSMLKCHDHGALIQRRVPMRLLCILLHLSSSSVTTMDPLHLGPYTSAGMANLHTHGTHHTHTHTHAPFFALVRYTALSPKRTL